MRDPSIKSYAPPFDIGGPIYNGGVAKVVKSSNPNFKEGDVVLGAVGIEKYTVVSEAGHSQSTGKVAQRQVVGVVDLPEA